MSLGQVYTDANTNNNDNDTNDDDSDIWGTNHDSIGSLACMPNEPKSDQYLYLFVRMEINPDMKLFCTRFVITRFVCILMSLIQLKICMEII